MAEVIGSFCGLVFVALVLGFGPRLIERLEIRIKDWLRRNHHV